ncbi:NAD(P)/FAD-dependent oxidoreductase [bacterium]|jgi:phytoene dehydrogenase-like protein|nr:NAD(P)/FAD-dependent oxidoreductase [bacterium]
MSTSQFDAIIIGAGHNGLVTAGYLAKAGLKVAVFERREVVGGCAVTQETWPGFKVSSLSYVNSLFKPEIVKDLELKKFGFEMLPRIPSSFSPFPDGRYLILGPDQKQNQEQISKFSTKDAARYPEYEAGLDELSGILEPMMDLIPPNPGKLSLSDLSTYGLFALKRRKELAQGWDRIVRIMSGSATDFLNQWFESEELKVTLATDAVIGANASPSMPGTAYVLFHHVMGECNGVRGVWGYMRGGMGGLSESLASSCRSRGVEIFTGKGVGKILTQGGRATGVCDSEGNEFRAKMVISNADPNVTFRKLMQRDELPAEFLSQVEGINYDSASVKINLALGELPDFKACPGKTPSAWHKGTIHLCPSLQYLEDAYADSVAGRPSQAPILECTIPSVLDNTLAPEGKHIMNIFSQYGPYSLREGLDWKEEKEKYADRVMKILYEYAPNLRSAVLHREVITPLDLEQEYSLTGGNLFHGRMTLDQMFFMRPVPGYADHRTPVRGLYMCGSGTHPGGGVMGTPGKNASRVILQDFRKGI